MRFAQGPQAEDVEDIGICRNLLERAIGSRSSWLQIVRLVVNGLSVLLRSVSQKQSSAAVRVL